jgi:hypothetical protein
MAGMIVMSLAMGVHEGVKKIQDKKEERKAKKAALVRSRVEIEYLCSLFIVSDINAIVANGSALPYAWWIFGRRERSGAPAHEL